MMRFPLIILVVFIHILPSTELIVFSKNDFSYYVFFSELISHNIDRIAVPCFFLFFGVGAYFGMGKRNIIELSKTYSNITFTLSGILLLISIYTNGHPIHEYIVRCFVILGIFSILNIFSMIQTSSIFSKVCIYLSSTVFFIYAVHEIYIINWLKGFSMRTFLDQYEFGKLFIYFTLPFICIGICLFLYFSLKKIAPKFLFLSIGGRR